MTNSASQSIQATTEAKLLGKAIFWAQYYDGNDENWNSIEACAASSAKLGFPFAQIPYWIPDLFDIEIAAVSTGYCDEIKGRAQENGCTIVEGANHVETQIKWNGAPYNRVFQEFAPANLAGDYNLQAQWASERNRLSVLATKNMGFDRYAAFSGAGCFAMEYPWPQTPPGLIEAALWHMAFCWRPDLMFAADNGVKVCFELHATEFLQNGEAFEMFREFMLGLGKGSWEEALAIIADFSHMILAAQNMADIEAFIKAYAEFIWMWHVKDARYKSTHKAGVRSFKNWADRPGHFLTPGYGDIDFAICRDAMQEAGILDRKLYATLEWECAILGKIEGAKRASTMMTALVAGDSLPELPVLPTSADASQFDDFVGVAFDRNLIADLLGIPVALVQCPETELAAQLTAARAKAIEAGHKV